MYCKYICIFKSSLIFKLTSKFNEPEMVELGFNVKLHSFTPDGHVYLYLAFHNNTDDSSWFPVIQITHFVDVKVWKSFANILIEY